MPNKSLAVESSNGWLTVHPITGEIIACEEYKGCEGTLSDIARFDITTLDTDETDILNTRFWLKDGTCIDPQELPA